MGFPLRSWFKLVDVGEEGNGSLTRYWGTFPFFPYLGRFLNSCNGLLLFCSHIRLLYYIYNPTTKEFVLLPGTFVHMEGCSAALAFNPCKSPHYKVVRFALSGKTHVAMDVYSSESGQWAGHMLMLDHLNPHARGCNGMFFFYGKIYCLSDKGDLLCFDLNVVNARRIDLPKSPRERSTSLLPRILGASRGHLCFARLFIVELNVWSLDDRCEGGKWILKHRVTTYDFEKEVPLSLRLNPTHCPLSAIVFTRILTSSSLAQPRRF